MKENAQMTNLLKNLDLSDFVAAHKDKNWTNLCLAVDQFAHDQPWRQINNADLRAYVILMWRQNMLWREELKQQAKQHRELGAKVDSFKKALRDEILQGVDLTLYAQAWATTDGDQSEKLKQLRTTVERKRAEWRAKCEIEAKEKQKERRQSDAKILRERAPGFHVPANWFSPMAIYHYDAGDGLTSWGYCQATGQDRKKVASFLKKKNQKPVERSARKGAGRRLPLYGFDTNLLVLDKWLGDWLLNSPDPTWRYQDSKRPGKTFYIAKPERVCEAIHSTVWHTAAEDHTDAQAEQFCAVLSKHLRRWKRRVKDPDTRRIIPFLEATLSPGGSAWKDFAKQQRTQWKQIEEQVRDKMQNRGLMPYPEVWQALRRYQELLG
jgi:hypothetical protein